MSVRLSLFLTASILAPGAVCAQDFQPVPREVRSSASQGDWAGALASIDRAIPICQSEYPQTAACHLLLQWRVIILVNLARYDEAEEGARHVLKVAKEFLSPDDTGLAESYLTLATALGFLDRHDEAETAARSALYVHDRSPKKNAIRRAVAVTALARSLAGQLKYDEAFPLYRSAIATLEREGARPLSLATELNDFGFQLTQAGELAEGEAVLRQAAAIRLDELSLMHPSIAAAVSNLALNLVRQGRRSEADPFLRAALEIREKTLPAGHPAIGVSLNNLAGNIAAQSKTAEAFDLYKRSADLAIRSLAEGHHDRIYAVGAMADLAAELPERLAVASSYLRDAEHGALVRMNERGFDNSDQKDFQRYRPIFLVRVKVAWRLQQKKLKPLLRRVKAPR